MSKKAQNTIFVIIGLFAGYWFFYWLWSLLFGATTTNSPPLTDVLASLITSPAPKSIPLSRGLTLAYTPPGEDGRARLTLAREKDWPSLVEVEVVRRDLTAVLTKANRYPEQLIVESWLRRGRWWYHALEWVEIRQGRLV